MNYTEGEWKVNRLDDGTVAIRVEVRNSLIRIATMPLSGNLANANLIAAAPNMYKALKEAQELIADTAHPIAEYNIEQALAKAEGKEVR